MVEHDSISPSVCVCARDCPCMCVCVCVCVCLFVCGCVCVCVCIIRHARFTLGCCDQLSMSTCTDRDAVSKCHSSANLYACVCECVCAHVCVCVSLCVCVCVCVCALETEDHLVPHITSCHLNRTQTWSPSVQTHTLRHIEWTGLDRVVGTSFGPSFVYTKKKNP